MKDLKPNDSMKAAAQRALDVVKENGIAETATIARARKIASGVALSESHVKRMATTLARLSKERPKDKAPDPAWKLSWDLWGGDSASAWVASRVQGVQLSEEEDAHVVKEMFFASPAATIDPEDGLVYKDVLRTGFWREGPGGTPLQVIAGHSPDPKKVIGLQDIFDNFYDGAIEHVTVPKTHADLVDENTGQVKKLMIRREENGNAVLVAGKHFTDAEIKRKVEEGSILNTSVGLEFDHIRKEDGKRYPIALRHVALTNRPWINRLAPFGVNASETDEDFEVAALQFSEEQPPTVGEFSESPWDAVLSLDEIKDAIQESIGEGGKVAGMAMDRVLVDKGDKRYVANFTVEGNEVVLTKPEEWQEVVLDSDPKPPEHEQKPVEPATVVEEGKAPESTSVTPPTLPESTSPEEPTVPEPTKTDEITTTQLSEQLTAEREANAAMRAQLDQLTAKDRNTETEKLLSSVRALGLSEENEAGPILKEIRDICLADTGGKVVTLNLSEEDGGKIELSATDIVKRIFGAMPTDEATGKLKVALSEQHTDPLDKSRQTKPPREPEGEEGKYLSEDHPDFKARQDELAAELAKHDSVA